MALIVSNNRILNSNSPTPIYQGGDMWTSGLEYAAGNITGYSGSAFGLGDSAVIVDSAYNKTTAWADGRFLTAHQDVSNLPYVKNASLNITSNTITGISGIAIVDSTGKTAIVNLGNDITYLSGAIDNLPEYSAGPNIDITNHVVSGKDWTDEIGDASSYAYEQATAQIPTGDWVESTALGIIDGTIRNISGIPVYDSSAHGRINTITNNVTYLSGEIDEINSGWDVVNNEITGYNGTAFKSYDGPIYSAGTNINITNNVISGKNWTTEINAATTGKADKTAIPTVVDYSAGSNINITNHVVSGKDWTTAINNGDTDTRNWVQGHFIPYTTYTRGGNVWSGTTAFESNSGLRITANSGWVELYAANKEYQYEPHVQVAKNYDNGKSFWAELDGGDGGNLMLNWNSAHIKKNDHSAYSDTRTAQFIVENGFMNYSVNGATQWGFNNNGMTAKNFQMHHHWGLRYEIPNSGFLYYGHIGVPGGGNIAGMTISGVSRDWQTGYSVRVEPNGIAFRDTADQDIVYINANDFKKLVEAAGWVSANSGRL